MKHYVPRFLVLGLIFLMGLPLFVVPNVKAVNPPLASTTLWSPWGPWEKNLQLSIFGSTILALSAFSAGGTGGLDILDVPGNGLCGGADFVCTQPYAGNNYIALEGWDFSGLTPATSSLVGVQPNDLYQCSPGGFATGCGFWSALNMRQRPNYSPNQIAFTPGGGNAELIRRSLTPSTGVVDDLNPFGSGMSPADLEVFSYIYDSMIKLNPETPNAPTAYQPIDWMVSNFAATISGTTVTQIWQLRNDLFFQNNNPVTSGDVCFTIIQYASNFPTSTIGSTIPSPGTVGCVVLNPTTLRVTISNCPATDPNCELAIGMLPILPASVWAPCVAVPATCPGMDPMSLGMMIGSGPWVCINPPNLVLGGPCGICNGTPVGVPLGPGCSIRLQRFDLTPYTVSGIGLIQPQGYMRCCPNEQVTSLHKFSWGDVNNDGCVNIADLADTALHWATHQGYWDSPLYGAGLNEKVDIGEISTVALYFHVCLTAPYTLSSVVGLDPAIDPFILLSTSSGSFFFIGLYNVGVGQAEVELAPMPGSPPITAAMAASFTANLYFCVPDCPTGFATSSAPGTLETVSADEIVFTLPYVNGPGQYAVDIVFSGTSLNPFVARVEGHLP